MNENIDLTKILKDCPIGWEFYSSIHGDATFRGIETDSECPVKFFFIDKDNSKRNGSVTEQGLYAPCSNGECTFFPSKEQRDWSKFTAPWYKKEKFDPKTLQPFDKVLILDTYDVWQIELFSHIRGTDTDLWYQCLDNYYSICIPYNDETKHLVGTTQEATEYYRYWED